MRNELGYNVSQKIKNISLAWGFLIFFQRLGIFNWNYTCLLYARVYAKL